MGPNYRQHLLYELETLLAVSDTQRTECERNEAIHLRNQHASLVAKKEYDRARVAENASQEKLRSSHETHMKTRQEIGEIEMELFRFGEDEEDYFH